MLGTSLTRLRLSARRKLTAADVAREMSVRGLKRAAVTVTAFERGQLKSPDPDFVDMWADIVGAPRKVVWRELKRVQRHRENGTGPFVARMVA